MNQLPLPQSIKQTSLVLSTYAENIIQAEAELTSKARTILPKHKIDILSTVVVEDEVGLKFTTTFLGQTKADTLEAIKEASAVDEPDVPDQFKGTPLEKLFKEARGFNG